MTGGSPIVRGNPLTQVNAEGKRESWVKISLSRGRGKDDEDHPDAGDGGRLQGAYLLSNACSCADMATLSKRFASGAGQISGADA